MQILVTGAAGFIGFHVSKALLQAGHSVVGLDILNDYYDPQLKQDRLAQLRPLPNFIFHKVDLADEAAMAELLATEQFDRVIHVGAQAGVRYSLDNPQSYLQSNLSGFLNILEGCRNSSVPHLLFASSSSVYGANAAQPYSPHQSTEHPLSLYAATKKANEMMAHSYAHLYGMPVTGLRFFTVYGPWGRPDMAYYSFIQKIMSGETIDVFNNGHHVRDFTYIDDVVEGIVRVMDKIAAPNTDWEPDAPDSATSNAPYRIYNIGNSSSVNLLDFIASIEGALGLTAKKNFLPMQPGDVASTAADVSDLEHAIGFRPDTPLAEGMANFVAWYRRYHGNAPA